MRPRTRQFVYLLLAGVMLFAATAMVAPLQRERKEAHLVLPPAPDIPAMSRLYTPLLAVARAPLVDVLWIRASKSKDEGRIFDAYQLANLICELEPKFPDVWAFQAWNMAYNISVTCSAPEERWRWVRNGYEQLRDKGIPLNPNNTQLYRELAWILFHKVGDFMDDCHWYYKNEFAKIVEHVLGEPPEGYVEPGRVRGDYYRNYNYPPLAAMPDRYEDLFGRAIVHRLIQQYQLTGLQPREVVELLDAGDPDVNAYVKRLNRPGLDPVEIKTLLDLLRVDLLASKAMVEELRREAKELDSGGVIGLIRQDPEAAEFARELDRWGFDVTAPGVFIGLMNSMRTGRIVMPNTPEDDQDKASREFLAYLRDPKHERVRSALRKIWAEHAGLDIEPIEAAQAQEAKELRKVARALKGLKENESDSANGEFGFDVSKKDVFLGIEQAIHDGNLAIPGVEPHAQEDVVNAFMEVWNEPDNQRGIHILNWFWRADRLSSELKLDPMRLVHMHNRFNVIFDYRFAESQSLYWANLGVEVGTDKRVPVDIHKLNTNRIELYCLQKMFWNGRIAMSPEADMGEPPLLSPDLRMVPVLLKAFYDSSEPYLKEETGGETRRISVNFETGYVGFMRRAILAYNEQGYDDKARELFDILRKERPDPMYDDGLDGFLMKQVPADRELGNYAISVRRIEGLIRQGIKHLAYSDDDLALRYIARAKEVYQHYHKEMVAKRQKIPFSFEQLVKQSADDFAFVWNRRDTYERICRKLGVEPIPESQRRPGPPQPR